MQDSPPNERKIIKLCEYAAKNPIRIPKVVLQSFYITSNYEHGELILKFVCAFVWGAFLNRLQNILKKGAVKNCDWSTSN